MITPSPESALLHFNVLQDAVKMLEGKPAKMQLKARYTEVRSGVAKTGRNELCPCASGRKFKYCCLRVAVAV